VLEIDLNPQFADLLKNHGIGVDITDGFINTDLPENIKFRARTVYEKVNESISSRLDVMAKTDKGEEIYESCGDYGATIEEAVNNNFQNFSASSLHPLLAALGCIDPHTYDQITIEKWEINGKVWTAYIGNLVPKILADRQYTIAPPSEFFDSFERGIKAQQLINRLHWFRGYYCQLDNEIKNREFLMDNELVTETDIIFGALPIVPNVRFYSCRNFIILKDKASD
jgi:Family of unknown function (DUF6348)